MRCVGLALLLLLLPGLALAEHGERLLCRDLDALTFHEELSAKLTEPGLYAGSLRSSWLGLPFAVGPELRIPGHGVSEIVVTPMKTWSPEPLRVVLSVEESSFPTPEDLDSGVMVTFHFTPLEEEEVKASLDDLLRRDLEPEVGPDLVVVVGGIPLAGSALSPLLPLDEVSVPVLERTAWEVATYLSVLLDCQREGA
jgi:hypothetical protein